MNELPTFTARELAKINAVLKAYEKVIDDIPGEFSRYSNILGCGNCGDLGPTYKTLYNLDEVFRTGILPKPEGLED